MADVPSYSCDSDDGAERAPARWSGGNPEDQAICNGRLMTFHRSHSTHTCMTQHDAQLAEISRQANWQSEVKLHFRERGDRVTGLNETAILEMKGSRAYTSPNGGDTRASVMLLRDWIDQEKKVTEGARGEEMLTCEQLKVTLDTLKIIESGSMSARNNGFQNMREVDEQSQKAPATSQPSVSNPPSASKRSAIKRLLGI